jgi:hypothetical protein
MVDDIRSGNMCPAIEIDGTTQPINRGRTTVAQLKADAGLDAQVQVAERKGPLEHCLLDDEEIVVSAETTLVAMDALVYAPSSKHKPMPSRGIKGTICPPDVDAQLLLLKRSDRDLSRPRKRWAWADGCAYCAHYDNVGSWHGWPVRLSEVPRAVWQGWLAAGRISTRDLKRDYLCSR